MFRRYIHLRQCDGYENKCEFYSEQVAMLMLHYVTEYYITWIQSYKGARMHVHLTKMTIA